MSEERRLPFGITSVMPSTMQTIADSKVTGFTIGAQKRSNPFQKHKEEAEMKRRKESEEAAKAYEEFVASFDVDPRKTEKTFVKGKSTMMPTSVFGQDDDDDDDTAAKEMEEKAKAAYKPQMFVQASASSSRSSSTTATTDKAKSLLSHESGATPYDRDAKAKRRRNMDAFLEELKRGQEERSEHARQPTRPLKEEKMGSRDTGDPHTTNLYIGNINPTVNEEQLCMEFAKYGPIASIKIMWPRTTEEIERNRNCGFVSFMDRAHAAVALKEMDGMELAGYAMKLGWGKAVALPSVPFYVHKDYKAPPQPLKVEVRKAFTPSPTDVIVKKPSDPKVMVYIHRVIEKVLLVGHEFEQALIEKEAHNPNFKFLTEFKSPEHIYYRWKLFSLSQGDTLTRWRTLPFKMVDGGPIWVPPLMPFTDEVFEEDERLKEAHENEFEKSQIKGTLSRDARGFFEAQLRLLTSQRRAIGRAMMFCMQHAEAADEIVEILVNSMILPNTPQQVRLARLYLISDILHNCSVPLPNVWKFRSVLELQLPKVFEALNGIYRSFDARLKAEQFRRQIANVLTVWENWIVFPQAYIDNLSEVLTRKEDAGRDSKNDSSSSSSTSTAAGGATIGTTSQTVKKTLSSFTPVESPAQTRGSTINAAKEEEEDIDGVPLEDEDIDGVPLEDEDLDGVPMDSDDHGDKATDGEPLSKDKSMEGETEGQDEDIDGVPMDDDDDIDGVPL
ncbi:U2 snRNP-associated SURP domain-containing protein [Podila epigama]|nr:U2 snRNP-associated SURP domain-containing protein [Podila epigama]